ncbi:MAG TPA: pantoate--beta-alanine ligase, partial [Bacteroidia bacterium]
SSIRNTKDFLSTIKKKGQTIGFVPTMGALHRGHISLLERAKRENNIAVSSIFVNPLQFNDKKDLEKYPRTLESDIEKLKSAHCDVLFAPTTEEMYPSAPIKREEEDDKTGIDLGMLDKVMEGMHRPGHFNGVCVVVKKLFEIVQPDKAYFGEKDFQQLAIIKNMVKKLNMPVEIVSCPTVREADGLAMSSRNTFLTGDERKNSANIYKTLMEAKAKVLISNDSSVADKDLTVSALKNWVEDKINENPFLQLEYFELVNSDSLMPIDSWEDAKNIRACIAVKVGSVRLIDNIAFS